MEGLFGVKINFFKNEKDTEAESTFAILSFVIFNLIELS